MQSRIERIGKAAEKGIDTGRILDTVSAAAAPGYAIRQRLLRTLQGVRDFGGEQVRAELKRQ